MSAEANELRHTVDRVIEAGAALRARSVPDVAESVAAAWGRIADPERALGRAARVQLVESSGLSLPSVAWALHTTLRGDLEGEIGAVVERMAPPPGTRHAPARLGALILAGNVFTACVRPWTLALLARSPVIVKASSRDDVLPRLFAAALLEVDASLAEACAVVTYARGAASLESALLSRADVVDVFGSDATIAAVRARVRPTAQVVAHGHGLGVGWVPASALDDDEAAARAADAFALDVAAYDQRGCLSPHAIFVERGGRIDAASWARCLSDALGRRAVELPRGPLDARSGAAQVQWRGVGAVRGDLHEGDGYCVAYEGDAPMRVSPGHRNVAVLDAAGARGLAASVAGLGVHLKAVGVAGDRAAREALADALGPSLAPRICAAGSMQTPPLFGLADGRPPWEGLLRYVEVE